MGNRNLEKALKGNTLAQSGLLQQLIGFLSGEVGQPGPQFGGEIVPPADPLQELAFAGAESFGTDQTAQAQDAALLRLLQAEPAFQADPALREEFFQKQILQPATRDFDRVVLQRLDERFGAAGLADSGVRADATSQSLSDFFGDLEGIRAELAFEDDRRVGVSQERALDRLQFAVPQASNLGINRLNVLSGAGQQRRSISAQQNQEAYNRFLAEQPIFNPAIPLLFQAIGQGVGTASQTNAVLGAGGRASGFDKFLGAANLALQVGSVFFPPLAPVAAGAQIATTATQGGGGGGFFPG